MADLYFGGNLQISHIQHTTCTHCMYIKQAAWSSAYLWLFYLNWIIDVVVGSDPTHSKAHHEDGDQSDGSSNSMAVQVINSELLINCGGYIAT